MGASKGRERRQTSSTGVESHTSPRSPSKTSEDRKINFCYGLNYVPHSNSYVEALIPIVNVFGHRAFKEIISLNEVIGP